jgi:hypothetical protein
MARLKQLHWSSMSKFGGNLLTKCMDINHILPCRTNSIHKTEAHKPSAKSMMTLKMQLRNEKKKSGHVEVMEESMIAEMVHLVKENAERVKKKNPASCNEWHCTLQVGQRPYVCWQCESRFALRQDQQKHFLHQHLFIVGIDILGWLSSFPGCDEEFCLS